MMANQELPTLGDRLAWALKDAGITQSYVAEQIGSTQAAISQWCTGRKVPTAENLEMIARSLGLNRQWLELGVGAVRTVDLAAQRDDYQRRAFWGFRSAPPDGGRDFGNANVW